MMMIIVVNGHVRSLKNARSNNKNLTNFGNLLSLEEKRCKKTIFMMIIRSK